MHDPTELERQRAELDEIDRRLLATFARRCEIVRRILAGKEAAGDKPLFDRRREQQVYDRARGVAEQLGLSWTAARPLMQVVIEQSHRIQEEILRTASIVNTAEVSRRFLIIGGRGRMGGLLTREFAGRGHDVDVFDRDDPRPVADAASSADIVMLAVPMSSVGEIAAEIAPHVRPDALFCDINSLKKQVCEVMAQSPAGEVVGLHPMFGPTVRTLRRQKVVFCPVRPSEGPGETGKWLLRELGQMGLELIESDPDTHDRMMAVVQVLVHFSTHVLGESLRRSGISARESLRYTSPIYRLELAFVGRLFAQNPDLYAEIEMTNPYGDEVRKHFLDAAEDLNAIIGNGNHDDFVRSFRRLSEYFADFSDEAMELSDFIIDCVVSQP